MSGICIQSLSKSYKSVKALDRVSLEVPEGQILVLFGPSGAGKSVLLRCIAGVAEPDEGHIFRNDTEITHLPPEARNLGMAFQNFALFPHLSAQENIASPLKARRSSRDQIAEAVRRVAALLKIDHVLGHAPRELSNGQKQRTSLARALVGQPDLLLLDDPLRNVDAKLRFEMRLELPQLLAGRRATVIYVTQDYKEAMALGHVIAVLDGGKIRQIGTPEDVYCRPANTAISKLFGDPVINLLDVCPERDEAGIYVMLSDHKVRLSDGYAQYVGLDAIIGLRPEMLNFADRGIPIEIEAETPFNEKIVILTKTKHGREILVSRPFRTQLPFMGRTCLSVEGSGAVLFDRATGDRIVPNPDAKEQAA